MLISRSGFHAFNDYDLSATLDAQLEKLRAEVRNLIKESKSNEVPAIAEKYKLTPLAFDIQNITTEIVPTQIPAEYFPSGFFVLENKTYEKDVFVFHLPFIGDSILLKSVPQTRILWTEEITVEGNEVIFELIKFSDDVEKMRQDKDKVINFLNNQASNINRQVEEFNKSIENVITESVAQANSEVAKNKEFLSQLGTPIREKNDLNIVKELRSTSRVSSVKEKQFDVFICHASEDKGYVDILANQLKNNEISVWYDSFQLGWGDDLRPIIDKGLKNSRYGIVIFSKAFLSKKKWTEYELNGLFSKERAGEKVILNIWYQLTKEDVAAYSPSFSERIAKKSDDLISIIKDLKKMLKDEK